MSTTDQFRRVLSDGNHHEYLSPEAKYRMCRECAFSAGHASYCPHFAAQPIPTEPKVTP